MLGMELRGKQLGIIGRGRIGRAVAARAPAFGMTAVFAKHDMSLDELLVSSDVISIHAPSTPETRHLIDRKALARMKRSAILVNTARGTARRRGGARVGARGAPDCRGGAGRLREGADRPSRAADHGARRPRAAPRQRHARDPDRHGGPRRRATSSPSSTGARPSRPYEASAAAGRPARPDPGGHAPPRARDRAASRSRRSRRSPRTSRKIPSRS